MKRIVRLTESDIHRIIRESVNRILREEWESPLDKAKKKRNDFDNVKKIDLSKFEKKSKKPKAGTFGDLPSFAKLKNRNDESRSRNPYRTINEMGDGFYHYSQNYRGVNVPLDMNLQIYGPKIDFCIDEKGWPIEKVQRAINQAYEEDM